MKILHSRPLRLLNGFADGMNRRYLSTFATNGAFYMFLSLFPLLMLISSLLAYTGLSDEAVLEFFDAFVPESMMTLIRQIIAEMYRGSKTVLSLSALATVWSAAKAFAAIIKGVEMVTGDLDNDFYLTRRLRASVYTVLLLIAFFFCLSVMVFGERVANMVIAAVPILEPTIDRLLSMRYLGTFLLLVAAFVIIYRAAPKNPAPLRRQLPGAVFTAAGWLLFSWLFSLYVSWSGSYSIYGSLATLVIAMLWMYYITYLLLIGAWLNVYISELKDGLEPPPLILPPWVSRLQARRHGRQQP